MRYLQGNRGASQPARIVVFDCETLPYAKDSSRNCHIHLLRLGVALKYRLRQGQATCAKTLRFVHVSDFWAFVLDGAQAKETTWIVAHNALFDLRLVDLVGMTSGGGWVIDKPRIPKNPASNSAANRGGRALAVIDGPPVILCLRHEATGAKVVCVDTLNWIKLPLWRIGEHLEVPKLPMPSFSEGDGQWFEYCERDVAITAMLFNKLCQFAAAHRLGNFAKTLAGQSMNAFRHRFMRHKIALHDEKPVQQLERAGFFGGRSECWRLGDVDSPCWQYDVNALYPSVMIDAALPVKLGRWALPHELTDIAPAIDPARAIAEVTIRPREAVYPKRIERGTVYPLGEFRTTLAGAELASACAAGEVRHWHGWAEYDCQPIFHLAMKELYNWRLNYLDMGQPIEAKLCKLLANSLFGKFGQRAVRWVDCPQEIPVEPWRQWSQVDCAGGKLAEFRSIGWHVQRKSDEENTSGAFVAIAAMVTAAARQRMNQLRKIAGSRNVHYQGVDSIIVTAAGRKRLHDAGEIHAKALGKLKLVRGGEQCTLRGIGDYTIGGADVRLGVKAKDKQIAAGRWRGERFLTAAGLFGGQQPAAIEVRGVEYVKQFHYFKRKVNHDGTTEPLTLTESLARS